MVVWGHKATLSTEARLFDATKHSNLISYVALREQG